MTEEEWKEILDHADIYSFFRNKIKEIGIGSFFDVYDYESLHEYFLKNRPNDEYKMFVCLAEDNFNEFVYSIKNKNNILTDFLKNNSMYYSLFAYSNLQSVKIFLNELKNNQDLSNCNYSFMTVLPGDVVREYMSTTNDINSLALLVNYNNAIKKTFFVEDSRALDLLNSGMVSVFHIINGDLKVNSDILNSSVLFNGLKSFNIIDFRNNFNKVIGNNPSITLEDKLNKYEEDLVLNFDLKTGLLKPYQGLTEEEYNQLIMDNEDKFLYGCEAKLFNNSDSFGEYLKLLSHKKISELIIDRLFKDNYYNVLINIKEMMRYNQKLKPSLIEEEYLNLYEKIINFNDISIQEKIEIFKKYKDTNLNTKFYEDIRNCKDACYNQIIDELYKPNNKNEVLSNKYNIDVYLLDGDEFSMIIRGLGKPYSDLNRLYRECFSLINQDNTSKVNASYYYGYNNINYKNIISMSENDAFSSDFEATTRKINRIMTSEEINSYNGMSEIQIKTEDGSLRPDYIVVFNEINEDHIYDSKRLGIPIVLINEEKYNKGSLKSSNLFSQANNYVNSTYDEQEYIRTHK